MFCLISRSLNVKRNMAKETKIISAILAVAVVGLWFYWFQYRPSEIRAYCNDYAIQKATEADGSTREVYSFMYQSCLRGQGL